MRSLSFSGRRYNRAKNKANDGGKGTPKATAKPDETQPELKIGEEPKGTAPHFEGWLSIADELAEQHGVSSATVERAGQFDAAVDKLGLGEEVATGQCRHEQQPTFVSQEQGGILTKLRPYFRMT